MSALIGQRLAALRDRGARLADWVERTVLVRSATEAPDALVRLRLVPLIWTLLASELAALSGIVVALVHGRVLLGLAAAAVATATCLPMIRLRRNQDLSGPQLWFVVALACLAARIVDRAGGADGAGTLVFLPYALWLAALYVGQRQVLALGLALTIPLMGDMDFAGAPQPASIALQSILYAIAVPALVGLRLSRAREQLQREARRQIADLARAEAMCERDTERFEDFTALADGWYFETGPDLRLSFVSPKLIERIAEDRGPIGACTLVDLIRHYAPGVSGIYDLAHAMHDELELRGQALMWFSSRGESMALRIHAWPAFTPDGRFRGYRGKLREVRFPALQTARAVRVRAEDALAGSPRALAARLDVMRPVVERRVAAAP